MRYERSIHICQCASGPSFPKEEVEAARKRVRAKREIRRVLAAAGIKGVVVR